MHPACPNRPESPSSRSKFLSQLLVSSMGHEAPALSRACHLDSSVFCISKCDRKCLLGFGSCHVLGTHDHVVLLRRRVQAFHVAVRLLAQSIDVACETVSYLFSTLCKLQSVRFAVILKEPLPSLAFDRVALRSSTTFVR